MIKHCSNCDYAEFMNRTTYADSGTESEYYVCNQVTGQHDAGKNCKHYKARKGCSTCKYLDMTLTDVTYKPVKSYSEDTYECQKMDDEHGDKPDCKYYEENICH